MDTKVLWALIVVGAALLASTALTTPLVAQVNYLDLPNVTFGKSQRLALWMTGVPPSGLYEVLAMTRREQIVLTTDLYPATVSANTPSRTIVINRPQTLGDFDTISLWIQIRDPQTGQDVIPTAYALSRLDGSMPVARTVPLLKNEVLLSETPHTPRVWQLELPIACDDTCQYRIQIFRSGFLFYRSRAINCPPTGERKISFPFRHDRGYPYPPGRYRIEVRYSVGGVIDGWDFVIPKR